MNPLDLDEFKSQGYIMIDFLVDYHRNVANYPVLSQVQPSYLRKLLPSSFCSKESSETPRKFSFSSNVGGGGVMLGTTCEAILCTLVAARDEKLSYIGKENLKNLIVYGSDQTHCALQKAASVAGIRPENFRVIKTKKSSSFALSPDSLLAVILHDIENGLVPCFLCATVGTTTTAAVDPIGPLCDVARDYGIWVHVDAAYADSSCLTNSLSTNPQYLRNKASESNQVIDYKDWQIALSRKFQSLKLWFVLRTYGLDNLRNFLRNHVKMAKTFEDLVKKDKRFEIFVPRYFSLVCFRVSPLVITKKCFCNGNNAEEDHYYEFGGKIINDDKKRLVNEVNRRLLDSINGSGKAYMTHGMVEGAFVIRCAIGATLTEEQHVIMAWNIVKKHATSILSKLSKA
ncbi:hypothetical protein K1719_036389 [Acacia pycnantha]|nr:hypothetical protein K1719_036389 [Acacia pycnantha]